MGKQLLGLAAYLRFDIGLKYGAMLRTKGGQAIFKASHCYRMNLTQKQFGIANRVTKTNCRYRVTPWHVRS